MGSQEIKSRAEALREPTSWCRDTYDWVLSGAGSKYTYFQDASLIRSRGYLPLGERQKTALQGSTRQRLAATGKRVETALPPYTDTCLQEGRRLAHAQNSALM